jgi:hypothetical protein
MNKLSLLLWLPLIFSCGGNNSEKAESGNILENLTVTLDTVRVDVGEELINVGNYEKFTLSPDADRIFYHYYGEFEIHEIDLDQMRLAKRQILEKDGPDRAPRDVQGFQWMPDDRFFMFNSGLAGIYDLNGKKIESIPTQLAEFSGLEELEGVNFFPQVWISPDRSKLMAMPFKYDQWMLKLVVVDLATQTGKIHSLPALELTKDYQVRWEENGMLFRSGDFVSGHWLNDQLAIVSPSTADFYLYDWKSDSLRLIINEPKSLPKMKTGTIPNQLQSPEDWREVSAKLGKMVNYKELFYDPTRQLYFRLATHNGKHDADNKRLGDEIWLQSFDLDFGLTGEHQIKEINWAPFNPFFKDGKLYSYTVLEEDLGFAILELKF